MEVTIGVISARVISYFAEHCVQCMNMISRNGSTDHQNYATALGADQFLVKPFAVEVLLAAAQMHLASDAALAVETPVD